MAAISGGQRKTEVENTAATGNSCNVYRQIRNTRTWEPSVGG